MTRFPKVTTSDGLFPKVQLVSGDGGLEFTGTVVVNLASFDYQSFPTDTGVYINGSGTGAQTRFLIDTISNNTRSIFATRRARDAGDGAPGAVQSGDQLGAFFSFGHDGTSFSSSARAGFSFECTENWTSLAQGTRVGVTTTLTGGVSALTRFYFQGGFWTANATGGDKGADTINAGAVYDDNVLLTDLVLDYAVDGTFDHDKYDGHPIATEVSGWWFDLDQYADHWKRERALPGMVSWDTEENRPSTGALITRLTAAIETQAVLIEKLNQEIKQLKAALPQGT